MRHAGVRAWQNAGEQGYRPHIGRFTGVPPRSSLRVNVAVPRSVAAGLDAASKQPPSQQQLELQPDDPEAGLRVDERAAHARDGGETRALPPPRAGRWSAGSSGEAGVIKHLGGGQPPVAPFHMARTPGRRPGSPHSSSLRQHPLSPQTPRSPPIPPNPPAGLGLAHKTKLVCTIGPATCSEEALAQLARNGMNMCAAGGGWGRGR